MVYIRFPRLKTGVSVSQKSAFDPKNLLPAQKMWLARNRIWGNIIGNNYRSGYKELKKGLSGPSRGAYYEFSDLKSIYPFINDWDKFNINKEKHQERRQRILQRTEKIGAKKGLGNNAQGMQIFEKRKNFVVDDKAAAAQKAEEKTVSDGLTDAELGI